MKNLKLIGAVGGAISLVLCWPLAVGQIGQNVVTDGLAHLSNNDISAELIEYDRGYLSSKVQTRYSVINPVLKQQFVAEGLPTEIVVESAVSHGLVAISALSTFPEYPDAPVVIETNTQLNGTTSFKTTVEDWHYQTQGPDAVAISMLASQFTGKVTPLGEASYEMSVPSIAISFSTEEKILLSNLTGEGNGKYDAGFWIGKQSVKFDSLSAETDSGDRLFNIENASYDFDSEMDSASSRFTSIHNINFAKVYVEGNNEVKDLTFNFTMGDLDSTSFRALSDIYQSNPDLANSDLERALPHVDALFSQGFFMSLDPLSFKVGEGEFSSKMTLNVPQGTNNVLSDPSVLLSALGGNVETFVSNQLAADLPAIRQGVDELVVMEMMTLKPEGYHLNAEIKEGNLVFANGNQVPLFALFMSAMMSQSY